MHIAKTRVVRRKIKQGKPSGGPDHGQHRGVMKRVVASLKRALRWLIVRKGTIGYIFLLVKMVVWFIRVFSNPK